MRLNPGLPIASSGGNTFRRKRPSVRRQKRRQRPAALSRQSPDRRLIPRVDIRPFVPIHLDGHERAVDQLGNFRILVAFAVDYVAPVAPHRSDVEQHRLVSTRARPKASSPHSCQSTGWCAAERK